MAQVLLALTALDVATTQVSGLDVVFGQAILAAELLELLVGQQRVATGD